MSETVFKLFKDPLYKATVKKSGKDLISYNVNVIKNPELEKNGTKLIYLSYEPINEPLLSDPYVDVKKIYSETIIQTNQDPITDKITFIKGEDQQISESALISNNNTPNTDGTSSISFTLKPDGTIERAILGKSANDTYLITFTTQTTITRSPNYKLWFYLVAWFSAILVLLIGVLSLSQAFSNEKSTGKIWTIFVLSIIIFAISVSGIFVILYN
jgi:hypothetical protein